MRFSSILVSAVLLMTPVARLSAGDQSGIESRFREALRTSTQQLNQLQGELANCKQQKADLDLKIDSLDKQAGIAKQCTATKAKLDTLQERIDEQTRANQKLETSLAECKVALESKNESEKSQAELTQVKEELTRIKDENASLAKRLEQAQDKNKKMFQVGREIIDWISKQGVCSAILACEPFLGLRRTTLENIAQDYDDKLIEQKLTP